MVTGKPKPLKHKSIPGFLSAGQIAPHHTAHYGGATVDGDEIGSKHLTFKPGAVAPGDYHFRIGTAGSTTLVLQTVLPALLLADRPSTITLEGGTHNPMAPPFDFLAKSYLPLVNRTGPYVKAVLQRHGFYPAGGGRFVVTVQPAAKLQGFDLLARGPITRRRVVAQVANLPLHIAQRECDTIARKSGWHESCFETQQVDSRGPGNAVIIEVECQQVTEIFTGFGERGVRAEQVAARVWQEAKTYLESQVPVGLHLADQLLLPLGLAAHQGGKGSFRTLPLSGHGLTHIEILRRFLDVEIAIAESADNTVTVHLNRAKS